MSPNFINSEVISNKQLNYKFRLLKFKAQNDSFNFKTGQFVVVKVGNKVFRSYSVASTPSQLPNWEIFIDTTPGGPGSQFMTKVKEGDIIQTSKPVGNFVIEESGSPHVMIATGCGLASIKPMVELLLERSNSKIYLLWGLRFTKDIVFKEILDNLQQKYPNFQYEIILSRPEEDWDGKTGHVTSHAIDLLKKLKSSDTKVYLCGNNAMIQDINNSLVQIKDCFDKIHFESYGK